MHRENEEWHWIQNDASFINYIPNHSIKPNDLITTHVGIGLLSKSLQNNSSHSKKIIPVFLIDLFMQVHVKCNTHI